MPFVLAAGPLVHAQHALMLDGVDDWISFVGNDLPVGNADLTISAWVNPSSIPDAGEGGMITFWGAEDGIANRNEFSLQGIDANAVRHDFGGILDDGSGIFSFNTEGTFGMSILPDDTGPNGDGWHHLLFYKSDLNLASGILWNGSSVGGRTPVPGVGVTAENFRIGAGIDGAFFHGLIDEVTIWEGRVDTEVLDLLGSPGPYDVDSPYLHEPLELVAHWNFENGLSDISGHGNHGTAMGNAMLVPGGVFVPEPSPRLLLGLGGIALFYCCRRARQEHRKV